MRASKQMDILNKVCKGLTPSQAYRRLDIMINYYARKQLELRVKIVGLRV